MQFCLTVNLQEICKNIFTTEGVTSPNVVVVSHSAAIISFLNVLSQGHHEMVNWDPKELKFMRNAAFMKIEVTRKALPNADSLLQFAFVEKYYSKHLEPINAGSGLYNANPLLKFATSNNKFQNCVQQ